MCAIRDRAGRREGPMQLMPRGQAARGAMSQRLCGFAAAEGPAGRTAGRWRRSAWQAASGPSTIRTFHVHPKTAP